MPIPSRRCEGMCVISHLSSYRICFAVTGIHYFFLFSYPILDWLLTQSLPIDPCPLPCTPPGKPCWPCKCLAIHSMWHGSLPMGPGLGLGLGLGWAGLGVKPCFSLPSRARSHAPRPDRCRGAVLCWPPMLPARARGSPFVDEALRMRPALQTTATPAATTARSRSVAVPLLPPRREPQTMLLVETTMSMRPARIRPAQPPPAPRSSANPWAQYRPRLR
jgi:hypothetical protein